MVSKADRKKYGIKTTTSGFPEIELALVKAKKAIGWKSLTAYIVLWTNENQPKDTPYSIAYWKPKRSTYKPPKMITITESEYKKLLKKK